MRRVYCEVTQKELFLPEKCQRIVSFVPAVTEALFLMGLEPFVVGVSAYCVRPEKARKKALVVGAYNDFKKEKLKELHPDLVLTTTGYQLELIAKLAAYPVYAFKLPVSVPEIIANAVEIGLVTGYFEAGRKLARKLTLKLQEVLSPPCFKKEPEVYVEIDLGGPVTFGAYSYITDALELLGSKSIFGNVAAEWFTPEDKKVKEADPDYILYEPKMFKKREKGKILSQLKQRFGSLRALQEEKVFITPGIYDFLAHPGPAFIEEALPWIKRVLHESLA